jgi:hypothetical protein
MRDQPGGTGDLVVVRFSSGRSIVVNSIHIVFATIEREFCLVNTIFEKK